MLAVNGRTEATAENLQSRRSGLHRLRETSYRQANDEWEERVCLNKTVELGRNCMK